MKALITGSAGLIGSEAVRFFSKKGFEVFGIDNDMRKVFFGQDASILWNKDLLIQEIDAYRHIDIDIRDKEGIDGLFKSNKFDLVIHTAAQPSHDWAASFPEVDFTVNANGTLILLEAFRKYCPEAVFIFISTNKVYGDRPNTLPLVELETRFDLLKSHQYYNGIDETMSVDNCLHSLFGVSKLAADILVQEYGKYFNLNTVSFRGGCLTGPSHSGTRLHGFLAYLIKCILTEQHYVINGYNGKQVRDNIHSSDLINAFYCFYKNPRRGEIYNIGGSRYSNISILEAISKIENITRQKAITTYSKQNRIGDHIWYISDISKFKNHYPDWNLKYDIDMIINEMCQEMGARFAK